MAIFCVYTFISAYRICCRFERSDCLLSLWGRFKRLETNRRPTARTRSLVSILRLCQLYQGCDFRKLLSNITADKI